MTERPIYGRTHSENGWIMVDQHSCKWRKVPGAEHVTLLIREGQPETIMLAFAADYHAYIEHLRDRDSACWTATNTVASSNHLSGTAMDLNWDGPDGKTFRLGISKEKAYPPPKAAVLDELIDFYEGMIFCGGEWSIRDWMHFQMGGNTFGDRNVAKVNDFIKRKIRSDGRSTFRRQGVPGIPPVVVDQPAVWDAVSILAEAIAVPESRATELLPDIRFGLIHSECSTVLRIAHWLAQMGHESDNWVATEEYQDGDESQNRWRYKGRTWIQITWEENYRKFGKWLHSKALLDDPEFFVKNPKVLAAQKWRAIGPAWYWTQTVRETRKYDTCNEAADHDDLVVVTQIINGGTNGLEDRQKRYNRARGVGDRLLALIGGDDELADPTLVRQIQEIHACLFNNIVSQSIYRGANAKANLKLHELIKNSDGMIHQKHVEDEARLGNLIELARIVELARGQGAFKEPWAVNHGIAVLAELERTNPAVLEAYQALEAEQQRRLA